MTPKQLLKMLDLPGDAPAELVGKRIDEWERNYEAETQRMVDAAKIETDRRVNYRRLYRKERLKTMLAAYIVYAEVQRNGQPE